MPNTRIIVIFRGRQLYLLLCLDQYSMLHRLADTHICKLANLYPMLFMYFILYLDVFGIFPDQEKWAHFLIRVVNRGTGICNCTIIYLN